MHDSVCPQPADTARSARPPLRQTWPLSHSFSRQLDMVRYGSPPVSVENGEMISTDLNWSTGRVGALGEEDRTIKLCFPTRKKVLASLAFTNTFADLISRTLYEFSVALYEIRVQSCAV